MFSKAVIRCDSFSGAGFGHLKRCLVLSSSLMKAGISCSFIIDDSEYANHTNLNIDFLVTSNSEFDEQLDALEVVKYANQNSCDLVIADSYRITSNWVDIINSNGLFTLVIDDLNILSNANLRINYSASSDSLKSTTRELLGPEYFITDSVRHQCKTTNPEKIIFHAGGSGNYSVREEWYKTLSDVARRSGLKVYWLVNNDKVRSYLSTNNIFIESDFEVNWINDVPMQWHLYDIVAGPASTSLFEAMMQGVLPISFTISKTQSSAVNAWLSIGHALHISEASSKETVDVGRYVLLAINKYKELTQILTQFSKKLDGFGADRIIKFLTEKTNHLALNLNRNQPVNDLIRACDFTDAASFLESRNAPKAVSVSTVTSDIDWIDHLNWWLEPSIEKFVLIKNSKPAAYFWHRTKNVSERKYLIGGWFPADNQPAFDSGVKLLDWQLSYCEAKFPEYTWVAVINKQNKAVLALNNYYKFIPASSTTLKDLHNLFPNTSSDFVVLQRMAKL